MSQTNDRRFRLETAVALVQLAALVIPAAALAGFWLGWAPQGRKVLPNAHQSRPVERA